MKTSTILKEVGGSYVSVDPLLCLLVQRSEAEQSALLSSIIENDAFDTNYCAKLLVHFVGRLTFSFAIMETSTCNNMNRLTSTIAIVLRNYTHT